MNVQIPNARNTDPISSHLAGEEVTKSGITSLQQERVARMVERAEGSTSAELAKRFNESRYMIARRLPELAGVKIRRGSMKKCSINGKQAVTWWLM